MNKLYFWIAIAILGLLLYISPGYTIRRMYEGFATAPTAVAPTAPSPTATTAPAVVTLQPSPAPTPAPPSENQIANLQRLLNTPVLESSTAPAPTVGASGLKQQPAGMESQRSQPESTKAVAPPSNVLNQGTTFMQNKPIPATNDYALLEQRRESQLATVPSMQITDANCPDMRDYIRKDSIPCWGCKLK